MYSKNVKNKKISKKIILLKNTKLNMNKIGNDIDNHMIELMIVISKNKNHFIKLFKKHLLKNKKLNIKEKKNYRKYLFK